MSRYEAVVLPLSLSVEVWATQALNQEFRLCNRWEETRNFMPVQEVIIRLSGGSPRNRVSFLCVKYLTFELSLPKRVIPDFE